MDALVIQVIIRYNIASLEFLKKGNLSGILSFSKG